MNTLWATLRAAAARLRVAQGLGSERDSLLDAQLLLAHALQRPRVWLLAHPEEIIATPAQVTFSSLLTRRLGGEPVAYILGQWEFWSLTLKVTPAVLVPRPETELVVERALVLLDNQSEFEPPGIPVSVADLGTGSGAIALSLAHERPYWRVTGTDRSAAALAIAAENAQSLGLDGVRWLLGAWLAPLRDERFNLIASNPPYVADSDPSLDDPALQHEPQQALRSGPEGLDDLKAIVASAADHLLPGGWLVLEHGAAQASAVARMLVAQGYAHVRCHADLSSRPRVTEAQRGTDGDR